MVAQALREESARPGLQRIVVLVEARADHWDMALPRDRHPKPLMRWLSTGRAHPREALLRAKLKWVIASSHRPALEVDSSGSRGEAEPPDA